MWDSLRSVTVNPTPFSSLKFAHIFGRSMGFSPAVALACDEAGNAKAGALVYGSGIGPYRRTVVPPFVQYTPLLLEARSPTDQQQWAARTVLREVKRAYAGAALHTLPGFTDTRFAGWDGWSVSPLYTYRLELSATTDAEDEWSESARRAYRKHARSFSVEEDAKYVSSVIRLQGRSYERHGGQLPARESALTAVALGLAEEGMVRTFVAMTPGKQEPAAGILLLCDGDIAHYWIAGSERGPAMTVLLGHVFRLLAAEGFGVFDFVGANTPSIAEFKRRFGPSLSVYFRLECVSARGLRLINWIRRIQRH